MFRILFTLMVIASYLTAAGGFPGGGRGQLLEIKKSVGRQRTSRYCALCVSPRRFGVDGSNNLAGSYLPAHQPSSSAKTVEFIMSASSGLAVAVGNQQGQHLHGGFLVPPWYGGSIDTNGNANNAANSNQAVIKMRGNTPPSYKAMSYHGTMASNARYYEMPEQLCKACRWHNIYYK